MSASGEPGSSAALLRKILVSAVTGVVTFAASQLLEAVLQVTTAEQLILTVLVGAATLLAQFLVDFSHRLEELEASTVRRLDELSAHQDRNVREARAVIDRGFQRISDATRFFTRLEASALQTDSVTRLVHNSALIDSTGPQLARDLAEHEIERTAGLLKSLSSGNEVFYEGEDREYLLGLAKNTRRSIVATSLSTMDAGVRSFEGGLWLNDLGARYVELQRAATCRGVHIRRIFVLDALADADDPSFVRVRRLQRQAGIEIRALTDNLVPEHLQDHVSDFIVFDDEVGYEVNRAARVNSAVQPAILTTRVVLDPDRVRRFAGRFEELWVAAVEFDEGSGRADLVAAEVDLTAPHEDVPDALQDVDG